MISLCCGRFRRKIVNLTDAQRLQWMAEMRKKEQEQEAEQQRQRVQLEHARRKQEEEREEEGDRENERPDTRRVVPRPSAENATQATVTHELAQRPEGRLLAKDHPSLKRVDNLHRVTDNTLLASTQASPDGSAGITQDKPRSDTRLAALASDNASNLNSAGGVERALASAQAALSSALLLPGTPRSAASPRTGNPAASVSPASANLSPRPLAPSLRSSVDSALRTASDYFDAKVCEVLEPRSRSQSRAPAPKPPSRSPAAAESVGFGTAPGDVEGEEAGREHNPGAANSPEADKAVDEGIPPSPDSHVSDGGWI